MISYFNRTNKLCLLFFLACILFIIPSKTYAKENLDGGWQINTKVSNQCLRGYEKKVFKQATANKKGITYKPIAVLGSSIAAGPKYSFFCLGTKNGVSSFYIVLVYDQADGKPHVLSSNKVNVYKPKDTAIAIPKTYESDTEIIVDNPYIYENCGGWQANSMLKKGKIASNIDKALKKANKKYSTAKLTPICLLASRVTNGADYKILCKSTYSLYPNYASIDIVTLHLNTNKTATIKKIQTLDVTAYH